MGGVRVESGDLAAHAKAVRRLLDAAGLPDVTILASGKLDEHRIKALRAEAAPIDGFGRWYRARHVERRGRDRCGIQTPVLCGRAAAQAVRRQGNPTRDQADQMICRLGPDGCIERDIVQLAEEPSDDEALLRPCMRGGRRVGAAPTLVESRSPSAADGIVAGDPEDAGARMPADASRHLGWTTRVGPRVDAAVR